MTSTPPHSAPAAGATGAAARATLPELERTTVRLGWEAFQALLVAPATSVGPPPPQAFALSRAEYRATLAGDHARVEARFAFSGLTREGWLRLPLLRSTEVALQSATLDGEPTALASFDERLGLSLSAEEAWGDHVVSVSFLAALQGEGPLAQGFGFAVPRAPITTLTVRGLRRDVIPSCERGFGLQESEDGGERCVSVNLPRTEALRFAWRPAAERVEVARRPPLLKGEVDTRICVGERALELRARVLLEVTGGPLAGLDVFLPSGFLLHGTSGEVVRDARPVRDAEGERLRVRFSHDLLGQASFEIRGEVPLSPEVEEVEAPLLSLAAGPRTRGTVAVEANPRVEVSIAHLSGASRVDPSDLTWRPASSGDVQTLLAIKYVRASPALTLGLKRHKDAPVLVATCDHAHLRALLLPEGKVFVKVHLSLRNNARAHLELGLPAGAELWSSYCGGQPVRPAARTAGPGALIPLLQGHDGPFEVELAYLLRIPALGDQGQVELALPALDLPQTHLSLALFLPERFRHFNFEGGLARVDAFTRAFRPPPESGGPAPVSNMFTPNQAFLSATPTRGGRSGGLGSEGQLPIRLSSLERGLEHRFEKSLVAEAPAPLSWEYKRRRRAL